MSLLHRSLKTLGNCSSRCATFLCVASLLTASAVASPEIPAPPQAHPIALVGATVHPASGPAIEDATILFDRGKIVALGREVTLPTDVERVDAKGKHIYPGLIDANSQLGLVEVPTVRGSRDQTETGLVNPNVKAEVAFNPDSELIPVARSGGVLTVHSVPSGSLIAGLSACMNLDGWTWEEMCLKPAVGLTLAWPQMTPVNAWWLEESGIDQIKDRDKALKTLRETWDQARAYRTAKQAHAAGKAPRPEPDSRWEAMLGVLDGTTRVFIHAEDAQQIQAAVAFAEQQGAKIVIVGGYDAPLCAALLKKHQIPVIVAGVHRLPERRGDPYDSAFTLPARLRELGIPFCIAGIVGGRSGSQPSNARNLPYHAGTAAAYGLPVDEALKAVTLYPAQILGVADRVGSLEAGKDASLIITDGDPLEVATRVTGAYLEGRQLSLNDRHKRLWEKYKEKYRRIGIKND